MPKPSPGLRLNGYQPEARCKLCKFSEVDLPLWVEVHEKVLHEGLSNASVMSWLNGRIDVLNAHKEDEPPITKFNEANFSKHFSNHISERDMMLQHVRKLMKQRNERDLNKLPPVVQAAADGTLQDGGPVMSSYAAMLEDIAFLRELLDEFKKAQRKKTTPISPVDLTKIQSTMATISSMTSSMTKFIVTGGLARTAVQYALDAQGRAWLAAVDKGLESVSHKLTQEDQDLFKRSVSDDIKMALRGVHEDLTRKFSFK